MFKKYKKGQNNTCFFKCKTEIFLLKKMCCSALLEKSKFWFP